jgi:asparagine synthase (glutamine-hydrolysing)
MCGIAGKVSGRGPVDRDLVHRMCEALRHRGPDAEGIHVEGPVGLGMRRLAIIDLESGDQPFYSEDGNAVLVLNGEIYNHEELRAGLVARGHSFRSRSDAEVVVHLWEEEGRDCVRRLRGMFAFAIWDQRDRLLFLARDRMGKKPLFYAHRDDALWFGSEPRALLQDPELPRDVDLGAIDAFLAGGYVPHERSAFAALAKLPPGSTLAWRPGERPRVERYWHLEYEPKLELSLEEAAERARELILEATRIRLMSDVPVGAFLSGGIDSSAVVAAMAMTAPEPVRTFSVSFAEQGFDETPYARMVAQRYGTVHEEIEVGALDASLLPRLAWHFGEPFADPAALPTLQLSELTRREVTVALSGDGGDEAFSGYDRYWKLAASRPADVVPGRLRRLAASLLVPDGESTRDVSRVARVAHRLADPPPIRYAGAMRFLDGADRARLYGPALRPLLGSDGTLRHLETAWEAHPGLAWSERAAALDVDSYLPDDLLAKVDVTSMAHSLEVRAPLLDQELVEFAARLPARLKLRGRRGKRVLRAAVEPWLPADVMRRGKHGFSVPIDGWLRNGLRGLTEELLLDPAATARGLFDPVAVRRTIAEQVAGHDRGTVLWPMICLELWYRTCVDAAPATPADLPVAA